MCIRDREVFPQGGEMHKKRQPFVVENVRGELMAMGVLYDDGNVQLNWRKSLGWTAEQMHSIEKVFYCEVGVTCVCLVDELPLQETSARPRKTEHSR